jgi:thiamine-phosphate diphosphorylase
MDMGREPWLCLVTDRRRLLRAAGKRDEDWRSLLEQQVRGAVRAGITFVQIRERDLDTRPLLELTRTVVAIAAGSKTQILVNDRVDVALAAAAHGVQFRADAPAPARFGALTPSRFVVGRSVHSASEVAESSGVTFFVAGTVFPTESKADKRTWMGAAGLATIVLAAGATPVLAIGGVTAANVSQVAVSGARGLASIGAFLPSGPGHDVEAAVLHQADGLRTAYARALERN